MYRLGGYMCLDSSSQSQTDTFKLVFDQQYNSRVRAGSTRFYIVGGSEDTSAIFVNGSGTVNFSESKCQNDRRGGA